MDPLQAVRRVGSPRAWSIALALAAAGCGTAERSVRHHPPMVAGAAAREQRELEMNGKWRNRPMTELVRARGKPLMILTIPGGGNPPGLAVVYEKDPASGCIDAFAITQGPEPVVRIYHCR